jgi:hypothetical protein
VQVIPADGAHGHLCSLEQSRSLLRIPRRVHPPLSTIAWRLALALGIVVTDAGEVGLVPQQVREAVMAVVRDGTPVLYDHPELGAIRPDDRLVVLRSMPQTEEIRQHRLRPRRLRERFTGDPDDSRQDEE